MRFLSSEDGRPPFEKFYVYILVVYIGLLLADLTILQIRPSMLPTKPPPPPPVREDNHEIMSRMSYNDITSRNIFSPDGVIPPPLSSGENKGESDDGPAVLSQLPLKLEGTIVHANPKKSVATILLRSANATSSFTTGEDIEGMARITKVERRKVTFRNLNNNRLEYIEIPKDGAINFGMQAPVAATSTGEVEKRGEFDFAVKRADLTKYTSDLSSILNQARMVPNIIPGTGGQVSGFRFVSIQPGSIYEKLGFKPMDVIKSVNGEPVNSPTKAMELYNALKSDSGVTLSVDRGGREETFKYNITE